MYKIISNIIYMTDIVDNDIGYRLNENDKTASVLGLDDGNTLKDIIIPESITSNDVSYNVISIEKKAFYESDIESIIIPNTIINIGEDAFRNAYKLKKIYFNCEKPTIGTDAFDIGGSYIFNPNIGYVDVDKYPSWKGTNKIDLVYINKQGYYKVLIKFVLILLLFFLLFSLNVYYFFISHKSLTNMLTIVPLLILPIIGSVLSFLFDFDFILVLLSLVVLFLTIIINTLVKSKWSLITRLPMALLLIPSTIISFIYLASDVFGDNDF